MSFKAWCLMFIKIFFFHSLVFFRGFQRKKDTSEFQNIKKSINRIKWIFDYLTPKSSSLHLHMKNIFTKLPLIRRGTEGGKPHQKLWYVFSVFCINDCINIFHHATSQHSKSPQPCSLEDFKTVLNLLKSFSQKTSAGAFWKDNVNQWKWGHSKGPL